jgi:hypothetical protein
MFHGTKAAISCTDFSKDKNGGCPFGETLSQIRTPSLFTDGMKACLL